MSPLHLRTQRGQVMVMAAILLPIMLGLCAFAVDLGSLYAQRRALQNAADSAALAGARELQAAQLGLPSDPVTKAQSFAARNGVALAGSTCRSDGKATVVVNAHGTSTTPAWEVTTSKQVNLVFGSFVGRPTQCVQASAEATASSAMMDIMLSLDTTGSMTLSGTDDFQQLRDATVDFINQVNPNPADTTTSRLGIARFAGIKCVYSGSTYTFPCTDDQNLLTQLTDNKSSLLQIANGTASACPLPSGLKAYGCPLNHVPYAAPGGTNGAPTYTGTKLPNAFTVLNNGSYYAWNTTKGGRATAHKVMVLITDGQNEASPEGNFPESITGYDSSARTLSTTIKRGPDGVLGTADDVEVYTVGFFCSPYSTSTTRIPDRFCKSKLADTDQSLRPCPGATFPTASPTPSNIDTLLNDLSSSTPGTCDHYYPLKKTDSLPELMQNLAKKFAGVRLTG